MVSPSPSSSATAATVVSASPVILPDPCALPADVVAGFIGNALEAGEPGPSTAGKGFKGCDYEHPIGCSPDCTNALVIVGDNSAGESQEDGWKRTPGLQQVTDLGDAASYSPALEVLTVVQGGVAYFFGRASVENASAFAKAYLAATG